MRDRQRLAAYGLAIQDQRVLLIRASASSTVPGTWWLPGGGIEFGESPTECLIREFMEETGLVVEPQSLTTVLSDVTELPDNNERLHSVRLLYTVRVEGGVPSAASDETTEVAEWHDMAAAGDLPLIPFARRMLFDLHE